ncbi:hypothetical protein MKOR_37820 [Mycolicibacillus koreensis]|uniref:Uncharacterized protein n=1 Tax=Mycolicibacillus koreensis TaxID=1069220 RepID=A0A7I7SJA6_9MYCO|nr:hypothetical protein B8W67_06655 [Mycolicibacillus koreensis]BBY56531.1 hypothetical protein MKOR_37820 [Mycolicibacillus koreensis]
MVATRLVVTLSLLALGAATLTGCSQTLPGHVAKRPDHADVDGLNPGNYPTEPRPDLGRAADQGIYVEARRMADFMTMPFEVNADLTGGIGLLSVFNGPFKGATAVGTILDTVFPASAATNYVTGFMVSRTRGGDHNLVAQSAVLRYQSPDDAVAAATELGVKGGPDPNRYPDNTTPSFDPIAIAGHPDARALRYGSGNVTVVSYTPHGPFLLVQQVYSTTDKDEPARLVTAFLDKQIPLIDTFKPTPVDKIPDLPLDPTGLLARTMEPEIDIRGKFRFGTYGVRGFLSYSDDPSDDEKLLTDAGVTDIALSGADVYHARDAAGAEKIIAKWAEVRGTGTEWAAMEPVPGIEGSRCHKQEDKPGTDDAKTYYACLFTVGDYAVDVAATQKAQIVQKASAQYLLLTAK